MESDVCCVVNVPPEPHAQNGKRSYAAVAACAPTAVATQRPKPACAARVGVGSHRGCSLKSTAPIGAHPSEAASRGPRRQGISLCRHWVHGNCTYGAACRFLHEDTPEEAIRVKAARVANPVAKSRPPAAGRSLMPRRPRETATPSPPARIQPTGVAIPLRGIQRANRFAPLSS